MAQDTESLKLGSLILVAEAEAASPLPLEATSVSGVITGSIARVTVTQRFGNPFKMPVELDYLFPLPHNAAIVDYLIRIGDRTIRAEIKEAEAARQTYQTAVESGKRASLLEQRRPNLFSIRIGNVQPGESITCELQYDDTLTFADGTYEFVFPMGITPRYHSPSQPVEIARSADTPYAGDEERIAPVEISLTLDPGVEIDDPISPSHALKIERQDGKTRRISLDGQNIPNKDFVLRYRASSGVIQPALWVAQDGESEIGLLMLIPPRLSANAEIPPREFIFVLDRSGSMSTDPMNQARNALKACLRALTPRDTFAIQAFDDQIEWFSKSPKPVTQQNVDQADVWLNAITSRGGTEILGAIDAALKLPPDAERLRYVVFLTDGSVSADEVAISRIARQRGKARIFTFGIGPSVNRFLLDKLAQIGRGSAEFIGANEPIETSVTRFQDRVSYPALRDIELTGDRVSFWDRYPSVLHDLYVDQPLEVVTRLKRENGAVVQVRGEIGGVAQSFQMVLPAPSESDAVKRLWARARIESLLDQQREKGSLDESTRQQIIGIALAYRLASPYTSFVAVDSEVTTGGDAQRVRVSVPLPEGLDWESFTGGWGASHFAGGGAGIAMFARSAAPMARKANVAPPPLADHLVFADTEDDGFAPRADILYDKEIEELDLSVRSFNHLKRTGIQTIGDVLDMLDRGPEAMLAIRNFGAKSLEELIEALKAKGYLDESVTIDLAELRDAEIQQLARTQKIDGSWDDDLGQTAKALLSFLEAGHTTRMGNYRAQVKKAAEWLQNAIGLETDDAKALIAARALKTLSDATGDDWLTDAIRERFKGSL